jgi:hypothetical protein
MYSQRGRVLWARPEALSDVAEALFLDLPPKGNPHAPPERPHLSLADHVALNLLVLKVRCAMQDDVCDCLFRPMPCTKGPCQRTYIK